MIIWVIFLKKTFAKNEINITFAVPKRVQIIKDKQWPVRLGVRTGDFHSSNRGSIPLRATTYILRMPFLISGRAFLFSDVPT